MEWKLQFAFFFFFFPFPPFLTSFPSVFCFCSLPGSFLLKSFLFLGVIFSL